MRSVLKNCRILFLPLNSILRSMKYKHHHLDGCRSTTSDGDYILCGKHVRSTLKNPINPLLVRWTLLAFDLRTELDISYRTVFGLRWKVVVFFFRLCTGRMKDISSSFAPSEGRCDFECGRRMQNLGHIVQNHLKDSDDAQRKRMMKSIDHRRQFSLKKNEQET
ncbi:hypothetical protein EVAR_54279_1 [Eumeta japonica]|uniref:Uncharacterized protein n=1 Tax=Eumeta variegata TaxID=151549 RepID=A0A4C1YNR4_EUMVA|nr:hypothetical protein EVAR_54279_1 [Eumeta japonica]